MHSHSEFVSALSVNPCVTLGKSVTTWILASPEAWTREGFLLAKDTVTLLALWRCEFIDESVGDYAKALFILSFVGSPGRECYKDGKSFFFCCLIFKKTK